MISQSRPPAVDEIKILIKTIRSQHFLVSQCFAALIVIISKTLTLATAGGLGRPI